MVLFKKKCHSNLKKYAITLVNPICIVIVSNVNGLTSSSHLFLSALLVRIEWGYITNIIILLCVKIKRITRYLAHDGARPNKVVKCKTFDRPNVFSENILVKIIRIYVLNRFLLQLCICDNYLFLFVLAYWCESCCVGLFFRYCILIDLFYFIEWGPLESIKRFSLYEIL